MPLITKPPVNGNRNGNRHGGPQPGPKSNLLATRQGTFLVAIAVALIAGLALFVFLSRYRDSVSDEGAAAKVLVASELIQKGSSGDVLATERMFRVASVRRDQLKPGAVTDPALLRNRIAGQDVLPGQQLVVTDFAPAAGNLGAKLGGGHRAMAIPVDAAHGLTGPLAPGDRVDVLAGFTAEQGGIGRPVIKKILHDVLVLRPASSSKGNAEGAQGAQGVKDSVVLRVPARMTAQLAFAADNGKLWLTLRPGAGVKEASDTPVTLESVLFGTKGIKIEPTPNGGR